MAMLSALQISVTEAYEYLSKTSIGVSGKIRLKTRQKIFTLTLPEHDSGDSLEGLKR
jgi:hypothetical protein